jgi:nitrate reductase NapD
MSSSGLGTRPRRRGSRGLSSAGAAAMKARGGPPASEWHVASLVVRHRPDAIPALATAIAAAPGFELALQDPTRSVLLLECGGTSVVMDGIDRLNAVPGVYAVNLVYHHVEPQPPDDGPAVASAESIR